MASIRIGYSSLSDAATLSAGSWAAGLPLANLKTDALHEVARSTDDALASTKVTIDFGAATSIGALMAGPTNLSAAALFRVRGSTSNTFPDGYTSGWLGHGVAAADMDAERPINIIHVLAAAQSYRYWQLEIDDTVNVDGYVEIGRLFMPKLLAPTVNYGYGRNGLAWEDRTRREETIGGVSNRSRRRNRRIFNFGIEYLPDSEAFGTPYQFEATAGFDKLIFVIPDPDKTGAELQARSMWGTVREMDPISQVAFGVSGVGLTIREEW
ncbi:MAG: hypothetical protein ABIY37_00725 [Devosia sp.]